MPITRQGLHPVVGWYGFIDKKYKDCMFGLLPSEDGAKEGPVKSVNCEALLPKLASANRWAAPHWPGFTLVAGWVRVAEYREMEDHPQIGLVDRKNPGVYLDVYRVDAPHRTFPGRVAVGWWTFSIAGAPHPNDPGLQLRIDGRIGDTIRNPRGRNDRDFGQLADFAGGRWRADEGGVNLYAHTDGRMLRYDGFGRKLVNGNHMMVHDP